MEDKNINDFLKDKMSFEKMELSEPGDDLVNKARDLVRMRKKQEEKQSVANGWFMNLLNFRIKLYHSGIATLLIAGMVFYFTSMHLSRGSEIRPEEEMSDSLNCSSMKANLFLVKNFSSEVN